MTSGQWIGQWIGRSLRDPAGVAQALISIGLSRDALFSMVALVTVLSVLMLLSIVVRWCYWYVFR